MTRKAAIVALFLSILTIAVAYGSAFRKSGTPGWSPWVVAIAVPIAIVAIMILGAARDAGVGRLKVPFAFVALNLILGFVAALALPATEGAASGLFLGLPLRAAIVIYGVGLLPIFVLPVAYALTFETQTLSAADVERVRQLGQANGERAAGDTGADSRS